MDDTVGYDIIMLLASEYLFLFCLVNVYRTLQH